MRHKNETLTFIKDHISELLKCFLRATAAVYLELHHQVQAMLPQWIDGVDNQCDDNVNAIGLMLGDTGLESRIEKQLETTKSPVIHNL